MLYWRAFDFAVVAGTSTLADMVQRSTCHRDLLSAFQEGAGSEIFSTAADCMLHGETPRHCGDLIYTYPPFFALLWTPLAPMPELLRVVIWYLVIIGTIVASLRLCETLVRLSFPQDWNANELTAFRILTFVLSLKFMLSVLSNQAYDSLAVVFILLGLLALINERLLLGGASLATAAALKVNR